MIVKNKRVLISGASIAGPALGYWLQRYGFEVTLVELAPAPRVGGYKVDIRGKAVDVVKKMGIYDEARQLRVVMLGGTVLDEKGKVIDEIPQEYMGMHVGDDIELWRGDLNRVLYDATSGSCEYNFGNSIKSVKQDNDELAVELVSGPSRQFDILVGADGIHSNVRSLVFGDESLFSHNLGDYFVAICSVETDLELDQHEIFYSQPDKLVNIYCTQGQDAKALFVFHAPGLSYDYKNVQQQKEIVSKIYSDAEWKIPSILKAMNKSSDFYFDAVKQIRMEKYFKDRTIVIGDAAFSPSLASGQGTSLALVGAYVLAGELMLADGDYSTAFAEYEKEMKSFVQLNQKLGEVIIEHMIPKSQVEPWIGASILDQIQFAANSIHLKDYVLHKDG
jgi:2-polyprenyl-6-methoxyphenol hydroxylase-like FAD-dependent oxidoreductase